MSHFVFWLLLIVPFGLFADSPSRFQTPNSVEEFREMCREHIHSLGEQVLEGAQVGETVFAPIQAIKPGQLRFCFKRMLRNWDELISKSKDFTVTYDDKKSAYGPKDALKGVLYNGSVILADGHHHLFASILAKSKTVPVFIVDDLSHVPPGLIFNRMVAEGYIYPYDIQGQLQNLPELCDLVNDPYLDVIRSLMVKTKLDQKKRSWRFNSIKGSKTPAIIKINDDLFFLELLGADALRRARFNPVDLNNLTLREIKKAHKILLDAATHSRLSQVLIPKEVKKLSKKQVKDLVQKFLKRPKTCSKLLSKT